MKKILITGGLGFIGSHLSKFYIKKGFRVSIIDNLSTGQKNNISQKDYKKAKVHIMDICDKNVFKIVKDQNYIIHTAGLADLIPSIENPEEYYRTNVEGTLNLISSVRRYNQSLKKFIYLASSTCYGIPKKYPTGEMDAINLKHPYAHTKFIGEEIINHYSQIYNINSNSLRLFNVYGTQSRTNSHYGAMFGVFLSQKIHNKPLTIVGNGKQERDFLFVSDLVNAINKVLLKNKTKFFIYNIGYGKTISINNIAKMISNKIVFIPERPGEPKKTHALTKRFKQEFNWKPKINIEMGVKILLQNIDYWKKAPLWTKNKIKKETKNWFKYLSNK